MTTESTLTTVCTYIEKSRVLGKLKVFALCQGLVVEVRPHVVSNGNNKSSNFCKVALITLRRIKELELDHVSVVAAKRVEHGLAMTHSDY